MRVCVGVHEWNDYSADHTERLSVHYYNVTKLVRDCVCVSVRACVRVCVCV